MFANLMMIGVILLSLAMTIVCVVAVSLWRKRYERRSPLQDRQVGHVPGQQLVKRMGDSHDQLLLSVIVMYFSFPVMLLAWALARVPADRLRIDGTLWMYAVGGLAIFGWGLFDYVRHWKRRQQAKDGLLAERVTGMQLNRMVAQGCVVLHDLPAEGFNIDHVVVAPRAVYAVETKSFRKPLKVATGDNYTVAFDGKTLRFPDLSNTDALAQAERYASWLARTLRDAGFDVPVIPALALPGWRVAQPEEVWRTSKVKVFSPMGGGANFMCTPIENLTADKRKAVAEALALRFPVIDD